MSAKTPDPIDIEVGHRIRIARLDKGISQTVLAEAVGVTFQQVQKYEKGVNRVGAGRLTKIAETCGISISTLIEGAKVASKRPKEAGLVEAMLMNARGVRLAKAFLQLNTVSQGSLADLADLLREHKERK